MNPKDRKTKIAFLGTPKIGAIVLEGLLKKGTDISLVITRPDKPQGRGRLLIEASVKRTAKKNGLPVRQPAGKKGLVELIKKEKPDLCIVAAFGVIIPQEALNIPPLGMINFHPSLLPHYRGPDPIAAPIVAGDDKTGITIIQVTEKMDAGGILVQKEVPLKGKETAPELSKKLARLGSEMLADLVPKIISSDVLPVPQNEKEATYTEMKNKDDGRIDWAKDTALKIERISRAYQPWPGVYAFFEGKKVDFYDIEVPRSGPKIKPGEASLLKDKLVIGTIDGVFSPKEIKVEGKKKTESNAFLCGHRNFLDTKLK